MSQKTEISYVPLVDIRPYWNNPRNNDEAVEGLKLSISQYGFLVPLVIDHEGVIITGHTRFKAAHELKLDQVPVIRATHLTPQQVQAFRLADNRLSENAKWDELKLSEELRALSGMGFSLEFTGFSKEELDCLCGMITADCLKDLDYQTVCGDIAPVKFKGQETMPVTVGAYRFALPMRVYKAWEADMLKSWPKIPELRAEIARRLGVNDYYQVDELQVEDPQPKAEAGDA